jgi:hypothetical protein
MQQPRQLYGLGSIVKKIGKAAKKVVKSDLGKAALLYAGTAGLGALGAGAARAGTGFGIFAPSNVLANLGTSYSAFKSTPFGEKIFGRAIGDTDMTRSGGLLNFLKSPKGAAAAIGATSLVGGMLTPDAQEDVDQLKASGDQGLLKAYLERYYRNLNPDADDETVSSFVRTNMARGGDTAEENAIQASGIMNLPLNQNPAGVTELDLRETGGFIPPVGVKEKADDIPAMLSNNEFVFTADAVRGMGDGDVNKGAQRMYDMMKKLENGGRV